MSAYTMPLASIATTTARKPATTAPTSGMKAPRKTRDASGSAGYGSLIGYVRATFLVALTDAAGVGATRKVART
ncbi:hypothetical protein MAHJHV59_50210 [Mycobacterium avium subsp. hominissuis]